ncbi:uncharacterized protein LOC102613601 [Citrus sinensis]|uniref:uncharacterized protein LOC102613601 n=1 Tax=Citrus sinensis TaxID=2711 RepID=UPI0003D6F039|nr:uncharacterized protein LOC102613601 [Citrus sinensis]
MDQIDLNAPDNYFENANGFLQMEWMYGPGSRQSPVMISDSPNLHLSASRVLLELDLKELDLNVPLPGIYEFFFGVSNNMLGTVSDAESDGAVEVINIDSSSETSNSLPPSPVPEAYNYQMQKWEATQMIRRFGHQSIPPYHPGHFYAYNPNADPNLYSPYYQLLRTHAPPSYPTAYTNCYRNPMQYQVPQAYHASASASTSTSAQTQFPPTPNSFDYDVQYARRLVRMFGRP